MENQVNLSLDELNNFKNSVQTLLKLQLGGSSNFKSIERNNNGVILTFVNESGNETKKNLNEIVIRTGNTTNTGNTGNTGNFVGGSVDSDTIDFTSSNVPTPVNNIQGGRFGFSDTSSDVSNFSSKSKAKHSKKNYSSMKGGDTNSDIYSQTSPMPNSNTNTNNNLRGGNFSETSPMSANYSNIGLSETSYNNMGNNLRGGNFSETSPMSANYTNMGFSDTSYNNMGNNLRGGNLSDTSPMSGNHTNMGFSETSPMGMDLSSMKGGKSSKKNYNQVRTSSDVYSATSNLSSGFGQNQFRGGALTESETINFSSDSNLDTSIFKKPSSLNNSNSQQKGGSVKTNSNNLRNQMKDLGIGSTSTSSVCE